MDQMDHKKARERSPNFPFISLERAIERARAFYAQEKRGAAPYARAVVHWGLKTTSSTGMQTLSALKLYGLLAEHKGANRPLQLTDLALRILLDQRVDSPERLASIQDAAKLPAVSADVYERWPDELPADSTLHHYLIFERRFSEANVSSTIRILKENQQFAALGSSEVESVSMETVDAPIAAARQQVAPAPLALRSGSASAAPPMASAQTTVVMPVESGHTDRITSLLGDASVTLHFSSKPDPDFYELIADYLTHRATKLRAIKAKEVAIRPGLAPAAAPVPFGPPPGTLLEHDENDASGSW